MRQGKLTNEQLKNSILRHVHTDHPDILQGAGVGEDCAVLRFGEEACVLSTDPITATTHKMGSLAVTVSVNDVASAGANPLGILLTVLAPPNSSLEEIEQVIQDAAREAERQGLYIIGGHTEVTDAVRRLVVSTTVVGKAPLSQVRSAGGAQQGDMLLMTKKAAPEGTQILANVYPDLLDEDQLRRAKGWSKALSVLPEGRIAAAQGAHAMHDVTEGGVLGACWEMAAASALGLEVYLDDIPVAEETRVLCEKLGIDPLRLIGSGVLLIAYPERQPILEALTAAGIEATVIGRFLPRTEDRRQRQSGRWSELLPPEGDELYRALRQ